MIDFKAILDKHWEISRRSAAVDNLRERATDISVKLTDMPRGGGGNRQEQVRIDLVAAQEAVMEAEAELQEMLEPLRLKMKQLKKWQYVEVIQKRYIEGKPVWMVASEIGYEHRQTKRFIFDAKQLINKL